MASKKYKPIGKHWETIDTVQGTRIYNARSDFKSCARDIAELKSLVKIAEKEYGCRVEVQSDEVIHGDSNRDGQSTQRIITHYTLRMEVDTYSQKDRLVMFSEELNKRIKESNDQFYGRK